MNAVRTCQAKQYSDQMICSRCGLQWDVNDPDPPECLKDKPKPVVTPLRRKQQSKSTRR